MAFTSGGGNYNQKLCALAPPVPQISPPKFVEGDLMAVGAQGFSYTILVILGLQRLRTYTSAMEPSGLIRLCVVGKRGWVSEALLMEFYISALIAH